MDVISKFVNILLISVIIFIAPLVINAAQTDRVIQENVTLAVTNFSDNVRKQGKLTANMYNSFINELDKTGLLYNIEMIYSKQLYTPAGSNGTSVKGDAILTDECFYTNDLVDCLFNGSSAIDGTADGMIYFNKDDTFTVKVTNKSETIRQKYSKLLPWIAGTTTLGISANAGGLVRDEVWRK